MLSFQSISVEYFFSNTEAVYYSPFFLQACRTCDEQAMAFAHLPARCLLAFLVLRLQTGVKTGRLIGLLVVCPLLLLLDCIQPGESQIL